MNAENRCPRCDAELAANAPRGLCPACLLKGGLATQTHETGASDPSAGTDFVPPTPAELAPHFPDLEILELVGQGGMGVVYKARQKRLDRLVALKILAPKIGQDPAFAERFAREARAMAMLSHPHIVAVYDFGQTAMRGEEKAEGGGRKAEGSKEQMRNEELSGPPSPNPQSPIPNPSSTPRSLYYFLMEFVDGVNLRRLLDTGKLAPEEALAIVPQICDALQYAHDHGVVHRDVKPENVLLDKEGRVKIADFGIAKLVGRIGAGDGGRGARDDKELPSPAGRRGAGGEGVQGPAISQLTAAGQIIGTPQYMAPEQIKHPLQVDHRADIYSLGVVFYQMLTGELPIGRFAPPSKKVQIDVRLDEVVLRALEKEPELRYQQASEIKTRVETIATTPRIATEHRQDRWQYWRYRIWPPLVVRRNGGRVINWAALAMRSVRALFVLLIVSVIMAVVAVAVVNSGTQPERLSIGVVFVPLIAGTVAICLAMVILLLWGLAIPLDQLPELDTGDHDPTGTAADGAAASSDAAIEQTPGPVSCATGGLSASALCTGRDWRSWVMGVGVRGGKKVINWPGLILQWPLVFGLCCLLIPGRDIEMNLWTFSIFAVASAIVVALFAWVQSQRPIDQLPSLDSPRSVRAAGSASVSPPDDAQHPDTSPPSTGGASGTLAVTALVLCLVALPAALLADLFTDGDWAMGFVGFACLELIALILGIVGWKSRAGKAAVVISVVFLLVFGSLLLYSTQEAHLRPLVQDWIDIVRHNFGGGHPIARPAPDAPIINNIQRIGGPWIARLPSGITVGLLGVGENKKEGNGRWWQPDGSPIKQRPYETLGGLVYGENVLAREFAVRLANLPSEPVGTRWQFEPSGSSAGGDRPNTGPQNIRAIAAAIPATARTVNIRFGLAAGPWQTIIEGNSSSSRGLANGVGVVFSDPYSKDGGVVISVAHTITDQQVRIVAVGKDGREHYSGASRTVGAANMRQITTTFPKVSLKDIRTFRFQARPYHWVEFRNVALQPAFGYERATGSASALPPSDAQQHHDTPLPGTGGASGTPAARGTPIAHDTPPVAELGYNIQPLDLLQIRAIGALVDQPVYGHYLVEPDGSIALGPLYGRAKVNGMTVEQAEQIITQQLKKTLAKPDVQVILARRLTKWRKAVFPRLPYTISPSDLLCVRVMGTLIDQPIDGFFLVEPAGTIPLGPAYGRVQVSGLTLEAAEKAVQKKLERVLAKPDVQVTLPNHPAASPAVHWRQVTMPKTPCTIKPGDLLFIDAFGTLRDQPIQGVYLVEPAGTVPLGPPYGRAKVQGLTLEAAEQAIRKKLREVLAKPAVSVTLAGWMDEGLTFLRGPRRAGQTPPRFSRSKTETPPGDMRAYLNRTRQLVRQRRYQEALDRFLWFDEHALGYDPGMSGVRLSFALLYWKELGDAYPSAKQAMIDMRDRKTRQLKEGRGNAALFQDVAALNRTLGENVKTVRLLEEISKTDAALAAQCWPHARDAVFLEKQYEIARKYIPSPLKEYAREKVRYDEKVALYENPRMGGPHFQEWNENHFVEACLQLIELAIFTGDKEAAQEIRKRAASVVDDPRLRETSESKTPEESRNGKPKAQEKVPAEGKREER